MTDRKPRTPKPLSFREKKTLATYQELGAPTVKEVQKNGFPSGGRRSVETCERIVRNSVCRLLKQGLLARVERGVYRAVAP